MPGIGIITNPHSKLNKLDPSRQRLLGYIVGEHGKLELTNSLEDLARAAHNFKEKSIEVLAINGGDGTISRTLTAFIHAYQDKTLPKILILRGGTMNVLADNLKIYGRPEEILMRYIESMSSVRKSAVVGLASLTDGPHYGFLFGNGVIAAYLEKFYANKSGPLGAVLLVAKLFLWALFAKSRFLAFVDEAAYQLRLNKTISPPSAHSCAIMAATIEKMPMGPKLFAATRTAQGKFQYFSLEMGAHKLALRLPFLLFSGGEGRFLGKISRMISNLEVSRLDGHPQKYTLDGELFEAKDGKVEISLGPMINFIVV
jgi:diacylglycerol kinase family enzyme